MPPRASRDTGDLLELLLSAASTAEWVAALNPRGSDQRAFNLRKAAAFRHLALEQALRKKVDTTLHPRDELDRIAAFARSELKYREATRPPARA